VTDKNFIMSLTKIQLGFQTAKRYVENVQDRPLYEPRRYKSFRLRFNHYLTEESPGERFNTMV